MLCSVGRRGRWRGVLFVVVVLLQEYARAIIEGGVKVVETAGSSPHKFVPIFKEAGITTIRELDLACTFVQGEGV